MTDPKPRKRSRALPILDPPFAPAALWNYGPGVHYDPSLPEEVRAAIPPEWVVVLDMPAFTTALGKRLGLYRYYTGLTTDDLTTTNALKLAEDAFRLLDEACTRLNHLPPLAKSLLDERVETDSKQTRTMLDRAIALYEVHGDLQWVTSTIKRDFVSPGRASAGLRDVMFKDVRDLILSHASGEPTKEAATRLLCRLMRAAHISIPARLEVMQRYIRRVERAREQEAQDLMDLIEASASRTQNST